MQNLIVSKNSCMSLYVSKNLRIVITVDLLWLFVLKCIKIRYNTQSWSHRKFSQHCYKFSEHKLWYYRILRVYCITDSADKNIFTNQKVYFLQTSSFQSFILIKKLDYLAREISSIEKFVLKNKNQIIVRERSELRVYIYIVIR